MTHVRMHNRKLSKEFSSAIRRMAVERLLRDAGQQELPLRVLYLGGWSAGPNLPTAFEHAGLVESREIHASTVCTILCCAPGLCVLALCLAGIPACLGVFGAATALGWGAAAACLTLALALKYVAVRRVLEADVRRMRAAVTTWRPHVVLGFSWGGAIALLAAQRDVWRGPVVLLNPASATLLAHARWSRACTLEPFTREGSPVTLVQGRFDAIVAPADTERLARTAAAGGEAAPSGEGPARSGSGEAAAMRQHQPGLVSYLEYEDDHVMGRCDAATVLGWIVGVLERRSVANMDSTCPG